MRHRRLRIAAAPLRRRGLKPSKTARAIRWPYELDGIVQGKHAAPADQPSSSATTGMAIVMSNAVSSPHTGTTSLERAGGSAMTERGPWGMLSRAAAVPHGQESMPHGPAHLILPE